MATFCPWPGGCATVPVSLALPLALVGGGRVARRYPCEGSGAVSRSVARRPARATGHDVVPRLCRSRGSQGMPPLRARRYGWCRRAPACQQCGIRDTASAAYAILATRAPRAIARSLEWPRGAVITLDPATRPLGAIPHRGLPETIRTPTLAGDSSCPRLRQTSDPAAASGWQGRAGPSVTARSRLLPESPDDRRSCRHSQGHHDTLLA